MKPAEASEARDLASVGLCRESHAPISGLRIIGVLVGWFALLLRSFTFFTIAVAERYDPVILLRSGFFGLPILEALVLFQVPAVRLSD
jgi:hypothetical protein